MSKYIDMFFKLKSAPDILAASGVFVNGQKEITEAIAMMVSIRKIALKEPMQWTLIDLCAGNGLSGLISTFVLPLERTIAVDKRPKKMRMSVNRYLRHEQSLDDFQKAMGFHHYLSGDKKMIFSAFHCCKDLAEQVIDMYKTRCSLTGEDKNALVIMPCCVGRLTLSPILIKRLGKQLAWVVQLCKHIGGSARIRQDNRCLSPCNYIIEAGV